LIRAVAECVSKGLNISLEIVGDGRYRPELERLTINLDLGGRVTFAGTVPAGEGVRSRLDCADLFVLPSYCEGLPRAMVEAMARALPCIGSAVGGIPELLALEDLFPAGNVSAFAAKIAEVTNSHERLSAMSERNLFRAGDFREDRLAPHRQAFFDYIRDATARWLKTTAKSPSLEQPELGRC
jgi:glycosyltransferase involved in cell wall biosynthesis